MAELSLSAGRQKVERKRRGTVFAEGSESLSGLPWLGACLEVLNRTAPRSYLKGDFWLFRTDGKRGEFGVPFPYSDFVTMLRSMSIAAVKTFISDPATIDRLLTSVTILTAQSLKATFLSELANAHADPQVLMSQGHWKTPEMPAKCTRDRQTISAKGIKEIIASLKAKWEGGDVNSGIGFSEDEEDETVAESGAGESSVLERASAKWWRTKEAGRWRHQTSCYRRNTSQKKKLSNLKLDQSMSWCPIEASLPRWLHWVRNEAPAR